MKKSEINVRISANTILNAKLSIPFDAKSLVIFSHGSGRSRFSTRNRHLADILNQENNATLITDLLTEDEDSCNENRYDIELLTNRLALLTAHVNRIPEFKKLPIGFFAENTGTASALQAAARLGNTVQAVVSRGGRPDLANNLKHVKIPVLLIVGSLDKETITLNKLANSFLKCEKKIEIIQGASRLFEEPGKLNQVAALTNAWFNKYLLYPDLLLQNQIELLSVHANV